MYTERFIPGVAKAAPYRLLNIAATCRSTTALGPGLRSVVWVQGCPFHCKNCVAPDWIPFRPATAMNPQQLADILTSHPDVTGVTLSGGEPFQQAGLLAETLTLIKSKKPLNVIAFTGYRYEKLLRMDDHFGIHQLLAEVDVLIDGGYIHALNDNQGLRGSSNQRIIHLTNSLKGLDLENQPRSIELHVEDGHVLAVGVPDIQMLHSLDMIFQATQDRS